MKLSKLYNEKLINELSLEEDLDENIKNAFRKVLRHEFIKSYCWGNEIENVTEESLKDEDTLKLLYMNSAIAIIIKDNINISSISQPSMNAFILKMLDASGKELNVLEIGSGTGRLTALMSEVMNNKCNITGLEINNKIYEQSIETLNKLGYDNISIYNKNGSNGFQKNAPYDRILFTASITHIPDFIFNQLKTGGLVLFPLITFSPDLFIVLKNCGDYLISKKITLVRFVKASGELNKYSLIFSEISEKEFSACKKIKQPHNKIIENAMFELFIYIYEPRCRIFVKNDKEIGIGIRDTQSNSFCIKKCDDFYLYGENAQVLKQRFIKLTNIYSEYKDFTERSGLIVYKKHNENIQKVLNNNCKLLSKRIINDITYVWFIK